ncbi:ankyrin repeat-containing domain protein [Polychytrium aggregatum]|uniref:ankyrin repeat-containing domain protein n=1 Tax=Polychytrium aggregatum TaxID=110093 RepID=UPI0022FE3612|nr:ankyrin repeat-containing domain protein [Polychytrium aggregatum]KAI9199447.1 ankyrin repeat-containing domain protein [Polychytrium aggregatum]
MTYVPASFAQRTYCSESLSRRRMLLAECFRAKNTKVAPLELQRNSLSSPRSSTTGSSGPASPLFTKSPLPLPAATASATAEPKAIRMLPALRMRSQSTPVSKTDGTQKPALALQDIMLQSGTISVGSVTMLNAGTPNNGMPGSPYPNSPSIPPRRKGGIAPIPDQHFSGYPTSIGNRGSATYMAECPAASLSAKSMTYSEFIMTDTNSKKHRRILYMIRKLNAENQSLQVSARESAVSKRSSRASSAATSPIEKSPKGEAPSPKKKPAALTKLNNLIMKGKRRKRTRAGIFHLLFLAIRDLKTSLACSLIEDLSAATLKKKRPEESRKIFVMAMVNCMEPVCMMMLEKGFPVNVNAPAMESRNPRFIFPSYFVVAVALGLDNVVRTMIKRCNPSVGWYNLTPLHVACCKGNIGVVQVLIEHNADITAGLPLREYTLLQKLKSDKSKAVQSKQNIFSTIRQWGSSQPKVDAVDDNPAWKDAKILPVELAAACGHIEVVRTILSRIDGKMLANSCFSLLVQRDLEMMVLFIRIGASVEMKDFKGSTPLHLCARMGVLEVAIGLVQLKANVNQKGENGWTPLHEAMSQKRKMIVKYLLMSGADKTIVNDAGETAEELGARVGLSHEEIVALMDYSKEAAELKAIEENVIGSIIRIMTGVVDMGSPGAKKGPRRRTLSSFLQKSALNASQSSVVITNTSVVSLSNDDSQSPGQSPKNSVRSLSNPAGTASPSKASFLNKLMGKNKEPKEGASGGS